ncbi:MAG: hypothetical protein KHY83_12645 [Coriobacteriia bacterium]|nr:hypothetical protein [Coriobacteriia bacterium]MBS5479491.1 hypothetical protein [Coriobacteriia bacterium]
MPDCIGDGRRFGAIANERHRRQKIGAICRIHGMDARPRGRSKVIGHHARTPMHRDAAKARRRLPSHLLAVYAALCMPNVRIKNNARGIGERMAANPGVENA